MKIFVTVIQGYGSEKDSALLSFYVVLQKINILSSFSFFSFA